MTTRKTAFGRRSFGKAQPLLGLGFALFLSACAGTGDPEPSVSDAGSTEPDVADVDAGIDAEPEVVFAECNDVSALANIQGVVLDEFGSPLPGAVAQMCIRNESGRLLCLAPEGAGDDGSFEQRVPLQAQCAVQLTVRSLLPTAQRASIYCRMPLDSVAENALILEQLFLPTTNAATSLPDAAEDEAAAQEVHFGDDVILQIAPADLFVGDYLKLAARTLLATEFPACMQATLPSDATGGVFFGPEGNLAEGAILNVSASAMGLSSVEGDSVEVFALGVLGCYMGPQDSQEVIEEGTWATLGTYVVDADGRIQLGADNPLPCLGTVVFAPR
ncbi:MAG: hypothetical protein GY822_18570 [Deltaproteobacteria bacterium]|nr:hypothetical protein [Deltaproteobacteria bacterium]